MNALESFRSDDFLAAAFTVSSAEGLRAFLRTRPQVVALRRALISGERSNFRLMAHRHRVMQRIEGLPIEGEGQLRFEAVLNDQHAAEHIVEIQLGGPVDKVDSAVQPS